EDDARGLAAEARVVLLRECGCRLLASVGQCGAAIEARTWRGSAASSCSAARALTGSGVRDRAQSNEAATHTAWVGHHQLLRRPVARNIRFTAWATERPIHVHVLDRPADLRDPIGRFHILPVSIHS